MTAARNAVPASRMRVRIGTLSLPGVPAPQAARIGAALRSELARLLAERGAGGWTTSASLPRLDAGVLRVEAGERPEVAGRRLARAIAGALADARHDAPEGTLR